MFTLITTILVLWLIYWSYKKLTKKDKAEPEPEPEKKVFSDELKRETQEEFYKIEKSYKSFKKNNGTYHLDVECFKQMILNGELKYSSGNVVTLDSLENHIRFREITEICLREGFNPKNKEEREIAEALLDLEQDDEEEDSSYDWDNFSDTSSKSSRSSERKQKEYGSYVIQYRSGSTWIDGPGSNDERVAESMFDRFVENDPRASNRCRLVYKVDGRVQSVLSTN